MTRQAISAGLCALLLCSTRAAAASAPPSPPAVDKLTYHVDAQRTGWNQNETILTPEAVKGGGFGPLWQSPQLDGFGDRPPRLFATPLYVHSAPITTGPAAGRRLPVAYVATTTGYAYAIATRAAGAIAPGTVLWRTRLTAKPCGGGQYGNLSTPVIDLRSNQIYVESCDDDRESQVHALDLSSGREAQGWPIDINATIIKSPQLNSNRGRHWTDHAYIQRGALNLSPDGRRLYVTFGLQEGWLVVVDVAAKKVAAAFSSTARDDEEQGGMWSSSGVSVDPEGRVYIATGANSEYTGQKRKLAGVSPDSEGHWAASILQFIDDRTKGLILSGVYTPFNYCQTEAADIDLGSSGAVVVDLPAPSTTTPHLLVLGGGKQGNFYLLDREHLPGGVTKRHPCSVDPETDASLLAPQPQPHFGLRGPINLFRPYSDYISMLDQAKSRSTASYFHDTAGRNLVFVSGSTKTGDDFQSSMPPGLAKVEIVTAPAKSAYPHVDALEKTQTLINPGSPVVSSNGGAAAIVWVLDPNARRTQTLYGPGAPKPILYAFDAESLALLWKSTPGDLYPSGKYNEPTVAEGQVLVGTDRLQAFGLHGGGARSASPSGYAAASSAAKAPVVATASTSGADRSGRPVPSEGDGLPNGGQIFQGRCSSCHGSGQPGVPTKAILSSYSKERIFGALTAGLMAPMASGLSKAEIEALVAYLKQ